MLWYFDDKNPAGPLRVRPRIHAFHLLAFHLLRLPRESISKRNLLVNPCEKKKRKTDDAHEMIAAF